MTAGKMKLHGLFLCAACLAGCDENQRLPFPMDERGSAVSTREEFCDFQKTLLEFDDRHAIPRDMDVGVLFDGFALEVQTQPNGVEVVSMAVKIVLHNDGAISPNVIVFSPPVAKGGIGFIRGKNYRVLAAPLRGKYYTWAAATADLDDQTRNNFCKGQ
jgi:hypothetical protein